MPLAAYCVIQDSRLPAKTGIGDFEATITGWTTVECPFVLPIRHCGLPSSPRKTGGYTRLINVQRKRPAIALTQPLHDTQTQTISVRRRLKRRVPPISVTAYLIGDQ